MQMLDAGTKLHLGTGALPRRKRLPTPVEGSRHRNAVQTARELVTMAQALPGPSEPPRAALGAFAPPLSGREGVRQSLPQLGSAGAKKRPPSGRLSSGAGRREVFSRERPLISPRLNHRLGLNSRGEMGMCKGHPHPPPQRKRAAPLPHPHRRKLAPAKKMTPIAVTPNFAHAGPPSQRSTRSAGTRSTGTRSAGTSSANSHPVQPGIAQATPSLMATLEARFDLVITPRTKPAALPLSGLTPLQKLLQKGEAAECAGRVPSRDSQRPISSGFPTYLLEPEPEPEVPPQPTPAEEPGDEPEVEWDSLSDEDEDENEQALSQDGEITMPVQLQTTQTGSSQRPWLLKLAGEGVSDGLIDSFVKVSQSRDPMPGRGLLTELRLQIVHFSVLIETGTNTGDDTKVSEQALIAKLLSETRVLFSSQKEEEETSPMGTSGSFFGTIKLPTDLSDICMNDEKDGEQRSLTDTPKRVQANRQLERVHGVPRVAKRLTTSNVPPSPGEGLSEEVVRNIKTPLESIDKGLEEEQLPLMEATVNCEPFEVFVNGTGECCSFVCSHCIRAKHLRSRAGAVGSCTQRNGSRRAGRAAGC